MFKFLDKETSYKEVKQILDENYDGNFNQQAFHHFSQEFMDKLEEEEKQAEEAENSNEGGHNDLINDLLHGVDEGLSTIISRETPRNQEAKSQHPDNEEMRRYWR